MATGCQRRTTEHPTNCKHRPFKGGVCVSSSNRRTLRWIRLGPGMAFSNAIFINHVEGRWRQSTRTNELQIRRRPHDFLFRIQDEVHVSLGPILGKGKSLSVRDEIPGGIQPLDAATVRPREDAQHT